MRALLLVTVACGPASMSALPLEQAAPPPACTTGTAALLNGNAYPTVQAALDAATPGAPVQVDICPGTWVENLELPFEGTWTLAGLDVGVDRPVLDGGGVGPVILTAEETDLTLTDVVLQHGLGEDGGAVSVVAGALHAARCDFLDNVADNGGGLLVFSSDVHVEDCVFRGNRATFVEGGGGGLAAFQYSDALAVTVERSTFDGNVADASGGAIRVEYVGVHPGPGGVVSGWLTVDGCDLSANQAESGSAVFVYAEDTLLTVDVRGSTVVGHVGASVGTVMMYGDTYGAPTSIAATFADSLFDSNVAAVGSALWLTGGLVDTTLSARLERVSVFRNETLEPTMRSPPGAVRVGGPAVLGITDSRFGSGPGDNLSGDLFGCRRDLGYIGSGWVRPSTGRWCP